MLRAKRETASQELEALVRQHDLWDYGLKPVLRIRIHMFLGLLDPDPDPLVRDMDPDPSITKQKYSKKNLDSYCFVTSF
jgi:hypothetical protein